jgi:hypothetical protein
MIPGKCKIFGSRHGKEAIYENANRFFNFNRGGRAGIDRLRYGKR